MKLIAVLLASMVAGSLGQGCTVTPRTGLMNVTCNGNRYLVSTPNGCTSGCGLIFDVHGFTMNTESQNAGTQMRQLGNAAGYVVVHPQGNGLLPGWSSRDDQNVFRSFIAISEGYNSDKARLHFGGFSQGAWMTWRMVCNNNLSPRPRDVIASFGPISAGLGGTAPSCFSRTQITAPTRVIHVHGERDNVVSFREAERAVTDISAAQASDPQSTNTLVTSDPYYERRRRTGNNIIYETIFHRDGHCMVYPGGQATGNCNGPFTTGRELLDFYIANPK